MEIFLSFSMPEQRRTLSLGLETNVLPTEYIKVLNKKGCTILPCNKLLVLEVLIVAHDPQVRYDMSTKKVLFVAS